MAVDLAAALDRFYTDDPNIVVINQGVASSGFARPDFFDWDKTAVDQVAKNSFDIAVMIVGTNDRQTIKQDGNSLEVADARVERCLQVARGRVRAAPCTAPTSR